jgi:hypothetical protein
MATSDNTSDYVERWCNEKYRQSVYYDYSLAQHLLYDRCISPALLCIHPCCLACVSHEEVHPFSCNRGFNSATGSPWSVKLAVASVTSSMSSASYFARGTGAGGALINVASSAGAPWDIMLEGPPIDVTSGTKLWVRVWARAIQPFVFDLQWENRSGGIMPGSAVNKFPLTTDYQLFAFPATTATVAGSVIPRLRLGTSPGGNVIAIDDIQVYRS